jgi:hypothetical protein
LHASENADKLPAKRKSSSNQLRLGQFNTLSGNFKGIVCSNLDWEGELRHGLAVACEPVMNASGLAQPF